MSRKHAAYLVPLALLVCPLAFAQAQPSAMASDATLLQVSAHGESRRVPDLAQFSAGVVTQAADANAAMRANAQRMAAVIAALRQAGIAERDIQTSNINVEPQYRDGPNQKPTISGYQVTNTVRVRLHDLARVGDVLDALVRQGANQIEGPGFTLDKPDAALDEARTDAIGHAKARADLYAAATGLKVRRIVSISESGEMRAPPRPMEMGLMRASANVATPVASGENTLAVDLSVEFELGK
jgi:uncharacterized protein YggE